MEVVVSALTREQVEGLGHGITARNLGERWRLEVPENSLGDVIQRVQRKRRTHAVGAADATVAGGVLRARDGACGRGRRMGRLSRVQAVAANTFRETIRERVLYNLVFFAVLMTLSGLLLGQLSIRQDEKIIKDLGLAAMDVFGTVIAIFIGVGLVAKEIERRSLFPLLAKPLSRGELLIGQGRGAGVHPAGQRRGDGGGVVPDAAAHRPAPGPVAAEGRLRYLPGAAGGRWRSRCSSRR